MSKNVTVIGNGPLSLSIAARAAARGAAVTYIDLQKKMQTGYQVPVEVTGIEEYVVNFKEVTQSFDPVSDAEIIMVTVTGSAHDVVFEDVVPKVKSEQIVAFFPACFGAINFLAKLHQSGKDATVCEAVSFPCVCAGKSPQSIHVQNIKSSLRMAVYPTAKTDAVISMLNQYFDIFEPAKNFLETSMDNMNMTLHPLPVLLNVAWVEKNADSFRHYVDGISPAVGRLMERVDEERMAIGDAFGLQLTSAYDQLVQYYGERNLPSLWEYASSLNGPYTEVKGFGLYSRYVEEDIPYLLVAAAELGKSCGVATPMMDMCVQLASALMKTDYIQKGYSLKRMGFEGLSKEEILRLV